VDSSKEQGVVGRVVEDLVLRKVEAVGWPLVKSVADLAQEVGLWRQAVGSQEDL